MTFDPESTLAEVRLHLAKAKKRNRLYTSRLDPFSKELLALHEHGASLSELQYFLRKSCRIRVHVTTICRWLNKQGQ